MDIKKQVECYIEERKYSTLQQASIVASALVAITMAAMNQNMVAAALGGIVGEFKMGQVTWVAGGYLLTLTAFQPLYGKFSDIFGRGPTLLAAMCLFMAGSAGCGLAQGPYSLIGWRAISGIGAGGLLTLPFIVISDMVALEKRSMYMGFIQITFGVCSVIGPLLGGAFVDMLSWRWVFFFSVPMSIVGLAIVSLMPSSKLGSTLPLATKLARIDMAGTATLLAGTVFLMFGLNVGGKDYAWNSMQVLSSLGLGVLLLLIFLFVELRVAEEPIVPFRMLNRNTLAVAGTSFSLGFTMSTAINYIPLYHQTAQARSFTHAGIHSIVFLLAISISAAGSGMLVKKPNHHRILMWVGMAMVAVCNALGAFIRQDISQAEEVGFALFIGLGVGLNIQVVLIMAQAFTLPEDMAAVTCFIQYAGSLGQVLGLAIHSAIFNGVLAQELASALPERADILKIVADTTQMKHALSPDELLATQIAYQGAFRILFLSLVPISILGLAASLCTNAVPEKSPNN